MKKIIILGFFNRNNLGDDAIAFVWTQFFKQYFHECEVFLYNTDDVTEPLPLDTSLVILGGGDVINSYFMEKMRPLIQPLSCPVYAIGVGFPYQSSIQKGEMDIFDFIITRNQEDIYALRQKYTGDYVRYFPDLTFMLPSLNILHPLHKNEITVKYGLSPHHLNIGVFLARPIYNRNYPEYYDQIVNSISAFLLNVSEESKFPCLKCLPPNLQKIDPSYISQNLSHTQNKLPANTKYVIHLFSMNTHSVNEEECDIIINNDIKNCLEHIPNIKIVDKTIDIPDIPEIFSQLHLTIATRFHAHIFSILAGTPVLSIYSTRKVESLLVSAKLIEYSVKYQLDTDKNCLVGINGTQLMQKFYQITQSQNYHKYQKHLLNYRQESLNAIKRLEIVMKNLFCNTFYRIRPGNTHFQNLIQEKLESTVERIYRHLNITNPNNNQLLQPGGLHYLYLELQKEISQYEKEYLAKIISYTLTGNMTSIYNYGLVQQILEPNYLLTESIKWILKSYYQTPPNLSRTLLANTVPQSLRKIKLKSFDSDELKGYHRSGWSFVFNNFKKYHRRTGILLDTYLDKTFGWQADFLTNIGALPYREDWVGFLHHTPNREYSENNLFNTVQHPSFKASLETCRGIFVLSNYLKNWLKEKLLNMGYPNIQICVLKHPTDYTRNKFTLTKLENNSEKKVIQIGAWMRDTYMIYDLPQLLYFEKYALKGKAMENYYPRPDYLPEIKEALLQIGCNQPIISIPSTPICRPSQSSEEKIDYTKLSMATCNKYIVGLYQSIERKNNSVHILEHKSDQDYDQLLSENIVMIYLKDVSGCNSLIECIVRETPILINRHPAVIEYLGEDYPFYYNSLEEAKEKLDSPWEIAKAHFYLKSLRKGDLTIEYFLNRLVSTPIYQSL